MSSAEKDSKLQFFCSRPFVLANITPDGNFSPCCRIPKGFGNVKESSLKELWNSDKIKKMRKDFLEGKKPEICSDCWNHEDRGLISERLTSGNLSLNNEFMEEIIKNNKTHVDTIEALEIRPSNACNFICRMCNPEVSSAWIQKNKQTQFYNTEGINGVIKAFKSDDDLIKEVSPFLDTLKYIKIHGGEPLFEPQVIALFESLREHKENIELRWITNLSVTDHPIYKEDLLKGWRKVFTTVSLDGPPQVCEYIRAGHKTEAFERNLNTLKKLDTKIVLHIALQALNITKVPEFCDYITKLQPDRLTFNKVEFPHQLRTSILPLRIKEDALSALNKYIDETSFNELPQELKRDLNKLLREVQTLLFEKPLPSQEKEWNDFKAWNERFDNSQNPLRELYPNWV